MITDEDTAVSSSVMMHLRQKTIPYMELGSIDYTESPCKPQGHNLCHHTVVSERVSSGHLNVFLELLMA